MTNALEFQYVAGYDEPGVACQPVLERADIATGDINDSAARNTDYMVMMSGRSPHRISPTLVGSMHPAYEPEIIKSIQHAVDGDKSDRRRDPTRASIHLSGCEAIG